jgi:hypothetical protein
MRRTAGSVALLLSAVIATSAFGRQDPPKTDPKQDPPKTDPTTQPPDKPIDPTTVKQDTAKITGIVETWYRLLQEREDKKVDQIGYAHERISKAGPTKYAYFFEMDCEYIPPGQSGIETEHISMQITGQLEDDFDPTQLRVNYSYGAKTVTIELNSAPDKRFLEFKTGDGTQGSLELDPQDTFLIFDAITLYRLRQRGDLVKPGDVKTTVPSADGGDLLNVVATVSKGEVRPFLGKNDTFATPVRLVAEGSERPGEYVVDRYGRILERSGIILAGLNEDIAPRGIRMVAALDKKDASGDAGGLSPHGRRDPFYKLGVLTPLAKVKPKVTGKTGEKTDDIKPVTAGGEPQELDRLTQVIKDLRNHVASNNDKEARKSYDKFLRGYKNLRDLVLGNPQQLSQLDALKFDAEKIYGGAELLLGRADAMLQAIQGYLDALSLDDIDKRIKEMERFREALELFNEDERRQTLEKKIREAGKKREQCVARRELAAKRVELTGVVVSSETVRERVKLDVSILGAHVAISEPVRFLRTVSFAVINDEYYREGDTMRGEGVRVDKILLQSIEVSYKGEIREVTMKKK